VRVDAGHPTSPLRRGDPQRVGRYRLLSRLGSGGMGVVYLGRSGDGTLVAVKLVHAHLAGDEEFRRRFRSEIARARQVPPFCTAEVLDADLDHEHPYLVVEYVDGPSLADVVEERGPLSPANLHSVAIGVATALTAIHGAGVIHRDLKPGNVLLSPGSPKVIDFGIARAMEATSAHTRTDQMVGTVAYMAPERFGSAPGTPLTPAADVFAWGVVVAFAGTGRTPFQGDSPPATAARILTQRPDLTGLSGTLRHLVELALAKDPADRPTARELLDLLLSSGAQPVPHLTQAWERQPELHSAAGGARRTGSGRAPAERAAAPTRVIGDRVAGDRRPRPARLRRAGTALAALLVLAGSGAVAADVLRLDPGALAAAVGRQVSGAASGGGGGAGAPTSAPTQSPPAADDDEPDPNVPDPNEPDPDVSDPDRPDPTVAPTGAGPSAGTGAVSLIRDPLTEQGEWFESGIREEGAQCVFDGALRASRISPGDFACAGPERDIPGNSSVAVTTALQTPGACASIWFRWNGEAGYRLLVCTTVVQLVVDRPEQDRALLTVRPGQPIGIGQGVDVGIEARGGSATVSLDGVTLGRARLPEADLTQGEVLLGIGVGAGPFRPPFAVAFADVDIRALTN
jgi:predicted Ser/Thr protein kinase